MELLLSLFIGIGLSATCGLRVFLPLLGMSIAAQAGHLELAEGFAWIGSWPALMVFAVATFCEIVAYYVPWLDNLLDSVASLAAIAAGTIVTASVVSDVSPMLRWSLGIIAGGGTAAIFQAGTVVTRMASTAATGGIGNPIVSTAELGGSILGTILALLLPILAVIIVILIAFFLIRKIVRFRRNRKAAANAAQSTETPADQSDALTAEDGGQQIE